MHALSGCIPPSPILRTRIIFGVSHSRSPFAHSDQEDGTAFSDLALKGWMPSNRFSASLSREWKSGLQR